MSKFKFTWGHGLVVALGCFMAFILTLVLLSGNMGEMMDEDYYEKTIKYQNDIDAAARANSLQQKPEIVKQANGYLLRFFSNTTQNGEILLLRPNNSEQDLAIPLKLNDRGEQLIHAVKLIDGDYEAFIRWKQDGRDYLIKKTLHWQDPSS
jgi:hypothetical protein